MPFKSESLGVGLGNCIFKKKKKLFPGDATVQPRLRTPGLQKGLSSRMGVEPDSPRKLFQLFLSPSPRLDGKAVEIQFLNVSRSQSWDHFSQNYLIFIKNEDPLPHLGPTKSQMNLHTTPKFENHCSRDQKKWVLILPCRLGVALEPHN